MEFQYEKDRIFATDGSGKVIAEIDFPAVRAGVVDICHTVVDDSLRGQGVASALVEAAANQIRGAGQTTITSCVYAKGWFEKHPEQQTLLADRV